MTFTAVLPWPPRDLWPNTRVHWARKAKVAKAFKLQCGLQIVAAGGRSVSADRLIVALVFCPPDRRKRDLDNLIAASKYAIDAIAAITGVDDSRFDLRFSIGPVEKRGALRVEVSA